MTKSLLKRLAATGTTNTDAAKNFSAHQNMETRWIKENELVNVLSEPADDIVVINNLKCF